MKQFLDFSLEEQSGKCDHKLWEANFKATLSFC